LDVAIEFLLARTGQSDVTSARVVAETVGMLPLALEQAAGYLAQNDWSTLAAYAELLKTRMAALMREGRPDNYPAPVATTWDLAIERIEQQQPVAGDLLRLCAFMAADDIPIDVIRNVAGELPKRLSQLMQDEIAWHQAVAALRGYSLVERQGDGLTLHRLVQWVLREAMEPKEYRRWQSATVRVLDAALPRRLADPRSWALFARLLPHAQAAASLVHDDGPAARFTARFMREVERHLEDYDDYLASLLQAQSELSSKRLELERALAVSERTVGPDHPDTATASESLGVLLQAQGDFAAARPLLERALSIRERVLGPDHSDIARGLNNLAYVLRAQREFAGSRQLLDRALAIREKVLGPDHPDTARALNNLAYILLDEGDLAAARGLLTRASAIWERSLAPDDPDRPTILGNLARLNADVEDVP
jgi:tetratricopeptide (TPR) repeat protein